MRRRCCVLLFVLATCMSFPFPAIADVDTSRSVSFGDSLTHNDLLYLLFGNGPALYGADPFEAAFNKAACCGDDLLSFAVLGSTSADVRQQVEDYAALRDAGVLQRATLISFQAGGNDILDNLAVLAAAPPGASEEADAIVGVIKHNILAGLLKLKKIDRKVDTVVWTVPDITSIPLVQGLGFPEAGLINIRLHIQRINRFIRAQGRRANFAVLDVYRILRHTVATPPMLLGTPLVAPPYFGDFDHVFADPIHPTAVSNAILANGIITAMNAKFDDDISTYSEFELALLAFPTLAP